MNWRAFLFQIITSWTRFPRVIMLSARVNWERDWLRGEMVLNSSRSSSSSVEDSLPFSPPQNGRSAEQEPKRCPNLSCARLKRRKAAVVGASSSPSASASWVRDHSPSSSGSAAPWRSWRQGRPPSLLDSAAKVVARHVSFATIDERLQGGWARLFEQYSFRDSEFYRFGWQSETRDFRIEGLIDCGIK